MNFDTCCRIFLSLPQKIADIYLSMTSNASCEQLKEGEKKIPKAVSHSILYNKVTMKTIWLTFCKNYLIKQIDSMLSCVCQKDIKIWRHTRLLFSCTKLEFAGNVQTGEVSSVETTRLARTESRHDFLAHGDLLLVILHGRQGDSVLVPQ